MSILALTSDTLIGTAAAGNIEYDGQFFGTDSNASRAQLQRITSGTAVASTSGTSIDFTSIPSWVKRITVMFDRVSTNGTSFVQVQLGTSGGFVITGYVSAASNTGTGISSTTGFVLYSSTASDSRIGTMSLNLISGTRWIANGNTIIGTTANLNFPQAGTVDISGTLDRVRITTVNGTDTFDAGSINIMYEG